MSFLLDALRKSEQSGRRPAAPTIHSEAPGPASRGGSNDDLLPTLAFVAPAFLLMCWFGLRMFEVGAVRIEEQPHPAQSPASTTPVDAAVRAEEVDRGTQPGPGRQDLTPQFVGAGSQQAPAPRTPVEQVEQDPARSAIRPASTRPEPATDPLAAASRAIQQAMDDSDQADRTVAKQAPAQRPSSQQAAPAPTAAAPERQNYIDYWELPDNVRQQLPELKLSVVVYSEQPAERFVLVNGKRLYEGDELQAGLALSEVRREGVIFSFRRYRFIYTN